MGSVEIVTPADDWNEVIPPALKILYDEVSIDKLPGSLPVSNVGEEADHVGIMSAAIGQLDELREDSLIGDALWRDMCALTGTFRTFHGQERILSVWTEVHRVHRPSGFKLIPGTSEIVCLQDRHSWVQARFTFETHGQPGTVCSGQIALALDSSSQWKIWTLTTMLEEIKGFPSPDSIKFASGNNEAVNGNHSNAHNADPDFDCVIVGAGFSGLCLAGRLTALGVRSVTLERNARVGDNWINRYDSARFHTTRDYSDFPLGRMFSQDDAVFPSRLDLARVYEKYADIHGLDIWCSSTLKSASYDEQGKLWTLYIDQRGQDITIKTRHMVLALGGGGQIPKMPQLPNRDSYRGEVLHSVNYKSADLWKGKTGVVVGSANTAHDIAEDMVGAGMASVTMIQRSRTAVFPVEWYQKWMDTYYNDKTPIEEADRKVMGLPIAIIRHMTMLRYGSLAIKNPDRFDALERAGFRVERSGDLTKHLVQHNGAHYTDVGGSAKIAAGLIKVKGNAALAGFTSSGLRFDDGSSLDADVIIFCTGFQHNMRYEVAKIVGPEIGNRLDDFWGIDDEGELRGAFKKMDQPGIWYAGGGAPYARFYSRFLALQIKADVAGCPLQRYTKASEMRLLSSEVVDWYMDCTEKL